MLRSVGHIGSEPSHRASFVHVKNIDLLVVIFSDEIGFRNINVFFSATAANFLTLALRLLDAIFLFKNSGNHWTGLVKGVRNAAGRLSNLFGRQVVVDKKRVCEKCIPMDLVRGLKAH